MAALPLVPLSPHTYTELSAPAAPDRRSTVALPVLRSLPGRGPVPSIHPNL